MDIVKAGSRWLTKSSSSGMRLAGGAFIEAVPVLKRRFRGLALSATKAAPTVDEQAANFTDEVKAEMSNADNFWAEGMEIEGDYNPDFSDAASVRLN